MSQQVVVSAQGLGKRYRLSQAVLSNTLRDRLVDAAQGLSRWYHLSPRTIPKDFWALRNVSFEVREGEVLGIVGHNGAGKSTLLKILSQITEPTEGEVRIRGRVGSLLEIGTGFHPELSGRENVFLNGAILGMSQAEIRRKFDEVVCFAGIHAFVDTPVKRYSSGMLVRLAFAVAAHLEPEILVIDEVLAVGDDEFQQKCLRKMGEVSRAGRTVLFVSHNLVAVEALCSRCILLRQGNVSAQGRPHEVLAEYRSALGVMSPPVVMLKDHPGRPRGRQPLMRKVTILDQHGNQATSFRPHSTVNLMVEHDELDRDLSPVLGVVVKAANSVPIFGLDNRTVAGYRLARTRAPGRISCSLPSLPLKPGNYTVDLYFGDSFRSLDVVIDAIVFEISSVDVYGTGRLPGPVCGPVLWRAEWRWEPAVPPGSVSSIRR